MPDKPVPTKEGLAVETALLGSILLLPDVAHEFVASLSPSDFVADKRHGTVFRVMTEMVVEGKPIDPVAVAVFAGNERMLPYLQGLQGASLFDMPTLAQVKQYISILKTKSQRRALKQSIDQTAKLLANPTTDVADIIGQAESALYKLSDEVVPSRLIGLDELGTLRHDELKYMLDNPDAPRGISTGLSDLDRVLGGFKDSHLAIIAGRPSMGKSALALNIAYAAATAKKSVLFFSLEMNQTELMDRLLTMKSGVDGWKISQGRLTSDEFSRVSEAMASLSELPFTIDDGTGLNIAKLRSEVNRFVQRNPVDIIFIDYLQLMDGMGGHKRSETNRVSEITEISRGLKILARDLDKPIVALSQLSRAVETRPDKRPILSDLRDSGSIEQDADVVLMLYRDDYYKENSKKPGVVEVTLKKHRNGPTGRTETAFIKETQRFRSLAKKSDQLAPPF